MPTQGYLKPEGIPSYETAQQEACKGNIYCWLCASHKVRKATNYGKRKQFVCWDCKAYFTYIMPTDIFNKLDRRKNKKSSQPDG